MALTQGSALPSITTTQGQQTTAPSWYTDYLTNLAGQSTAGMQNAQFVGAQPLQQQAFGAAAALPGTYQGVNTAATNMAQAVGQNNIGDMAGQMMQPYTSQVVDALGVLGRRNIDQYLAPQATAGAVGSGQFGSKRGAEVLGQAMNVGLQNLNAAQSQALQTGYTQALTAAQQQQQNQLAAAQQMGALGTAGQAMSLADINALATMGGQQQTMSQNQQLFPLQAANLGAQTLQGYSIPTGVSSTYTGPIPGAYSASPLQQIAGLGAVIAGTGNTPFGAAIGSGVANALGNPSTWFNRPPVTGDTTPAGVPSGAWSVGDGTYVSSDGTTYDASGNVTWTPPFSFNPVEGDGSGGTGDFLPDWSDENVDNQP